MLRNPIFFAILLLALVYPAQANPLTLKTTYRPRGGAIIAVSFRKDSRQVAIGTHAGLLKVKDLDGDVGAGTSLRDAAGWLAYSPLVYNTHAHGAPTGSGSLVTLSPSGRFAVYYTDDYDNQTEAEFGPTHGHIVPFGSLSADGRYLAFTKGGPDIWIGRPAEARKKSWQRPRTDWSASVMRRPADVAGDVRSISLDRDGSLLAAAYDTGNRGAVVVFNRHTGNTLRVHHLDFVPRAVAYSPRGKYLAAVGRGYVWLGVPSGETGAELVAPAEAVTCIAFSPDERWLAAGCADGNVYLWSTDAERTVATMKAHDESITAIAWAPDGKMLATGSAEGVVKVWDVSRSKP